MTFDPVSIVERAFAPSDRGLEAWLDEVGGVVCDAVAPRGGPEWAWLQDHDGPRLVRGAREAIVQTDPPWASPGLSTATLARGEVRWVVTPPAPYQAAFGMLSDHPLPPDDARRRLWRYLAVHLALALLDAAGCPRAGRPLREAAEDLALWRRVLVGTWRFVDRRTADGCMHVAAEERPRGEAGLTRRQRQVAFYASLGCSNKEIGYHLGLAENTVSAHLQRAMAKMGIADRSELVRLAGRVTASAEVSLTASPRISGVIRM